MGQRGLFQFVDGLESVAQRAGGLGLERLPAGQLGQTAHGDRVVLVDDAGEHFVAELVGHADDGLARPADGDGVNPDAEGGGLARGLDRVELAGVALAVGDEDHDFRFALLFVELGGGGGDGGADGGAVLDQADADAVDAFQDPIVLHGGHAHRIRAAGEGNRADAVVRAAFDEFLANGAGGGEAVNLLAGQFEILGGHRAGNIEGDQDFDAAELALLLHRDLLRACHRDGGEHEGGHQQEPAR